MAGERSPEKVDEGETAKNVTEGVLSEDIVRRRRLWIQRRRGRNRGAERWGFGFGFGFGFGLPFGFGFASVLLPHGCSWRKVVENCDSTRMKTDLPSI